MLVLHDSFLASCVWCCILMCCTLLLIAIMMWCVLMVTLWYGWWRGYYLRYDMMWFDMICLMSEIFIALWCDVVWDYVSCSTVAIMMRWMLPIELRYDMYVTCLLMVSVMMFMFLLHCYAVIMFFIWRCRGRDVHWPCNLLDWFLCGVSCVNVLWRGVGRSLAYTCYCRIYMQHLMWRFMCSVCSQLYLPQCVCDVMVCGTDLWWWWSLRQPASSLREGHVLSVCRLEPVCLAELYHRVWPDYR